MKDGLSQEERYNRVERVKPFAVVDDGMESLIRQAETLARCIHYYNMSGKKEGDFSSFFDLAEAYRRKNDDGGMEPSQGLLFTFLHQLHRLCGGFNKRWEQYIYWYINDCLEVTPRPVVADSTWLTFSKNTRKPVFIPAHTGFIFSGEADAEPVVYRSTEPLYLTNASVARAYSLHFDRNGYIYPACLFRIPTALKMKKIPGGKAEEVLFDGRITPEHTTPIGLSVSSPMLLLREGKRFVSITFETERGMFRNILHRKNLVRLLRNVQQEMAPISRENAKEVLLIKLFSDIFYLEISTPAGWHTIEDYVVKRESLSSGTANRGISLTFELPEDFPPTAACTADVHRQASEYPTLKILLNRNAWLYPWSWLKDFRIARIHLQVEVQEMHNVLFYNELGKVDNSVPFAPFGNNTEQGAWFALGNYEMAMKQVQWAQVCINWQQLPADDGGLFSYYQGYSEPVDNRSFRVKTRYLSDYKWKETPAEEDHYLFSSVYTDRDGAPAARQKLSDQTSLKGIALYEMKPVYMKEEEYDYSIHSKSGFFSMMLDAPDMGLGEKAYRRLFSEQLIRRTLQKRKGPLLNPPVTPLVERITLSYQAAEEIDFRVCGENGPTRVSHLYPLGAKVVYPSAENTPVPFVFSLDTDANILVGLENIRGDEYVHLFVDFFPQKKEIRLGDLPRVRWYWGNGYEWNVLPDEAVTVNTTKNLLCSGKIKIYLPDIPGSGYRDEDGLVWLRAGITENEQSIPGIKNIYTHAVQVVREAESMGRELPDGFTVDSSLEGLPGIEAVVQVTPFVPGLPAEDDRARLIRVSEFITHRNRAVSARDYERIALQAFPQVGKVKCLPGSGGKVSLLVIPLVPQESRRGIHFRPYAPAELLLDIERYFRAVTSPFVTEVDAVNPVYEEILVRCAVDFYLTEQSKAFLRSVVRKVVNHTIAPWQQQGNLPVPGYSFPLQELYDRIQGLDFVKETGHLSVVQILQDSETDTYRFREYSELKDTICPSSARAVLVPFRHHIINPAVNETFGIEEMGIHEHFVIWQNETGKH